MSQDNNSNENKIKQKKKNGKDFEKSGEENINMGKKK